MYETASRDECLVCFGPQYINGDFWSVIGFDNICGDCRSLFQKTYRFKYFNNTIFIPLYHYTDDISKLLIRYKDFYDTALSPIFLKRFTFLFNVVFKDYVIVPIPSILAKVTERGFNHLHGMLVDVNNDIVDCLRNNSEELQRFKSAGKKAMISFSCYNESLITNKKVIIFDDVATSGNSLREAIRILEKYASRVVVISVFVSKQLMDERGLKNDWKSEVV